MAPIDNPLQDFRCFEGITEAWELVKTGFVVLNGVSYRLELWHSYSNPDIAYYVSTYVQEDGAWRKRPDRAFPLGQTGDQALRSAMAFLVEGRAA